MSHAPRVLNLQQRLVADVVAAGYDAMFADEVIERFLIGQLRTTTTAVRRTATGQPGIAQLS